MEWHSGAEAKRVVSGRAPETRHPTELTTPRESAGSPRFPGDNALLSRQTENHLTISVVLRVCLLHLGQLVGNAGHRAVRGGAA
jgi:hypothetical protein